MYCAQLHRDKKDRPMSGKCCASDFVFLQKKQCYCLDIFRLQTPALVENGWATPLCTGRVGGGPRGTTESPL